MTKAKGARNGVRLVFTCFFRAWGLPWRFSDIYGRLAQRKKAKR